MTTTSDSAARTDFSIDSATLHDQDFQLKLEKFVSEATDINVYEASNGLWKSSDAK